MKKTKVSWFVTLECRGASSRNDLSLLSFKYLVGLPN